MINSYYLFSILSRVIIIISVNSADAYFINGILKVRNNLWIFKNSNNYNTKKSSFKNHERSKSYNIKN